MIAWQLLLLQRPSYPVPSPLHHQTILSKSIFEHLLDYPQVASIALSSREIQCSSLAPNFAFNVIMNKESAPLFRNAFFEPSSPIQFVPGLHINSMQCKPFVESLRASKYFHKSLRFLTVHAIPPSEFLRLFVHDDHNNTFMNLQELTLEKCHLYDHDIYLINSSLPSLRAVNVETVNSSGDTAVQIACKITKLTSLITCGDLLSDTGIRHITNHNNSASLVCLRIGTMPWKQSLYSDSALMGIGKMTSLRTLQLAYCPHITPNGLLSSSGAA